MKEIFKVCCDGSNTFNAYYNFCNENEIPIYSPYWEYSQFVFEFDSEDMAILFKLSLE